MKDYIVQVISKKLLSAGVLELSVKLIKPKAMRFQPGQFVFFKVGGAFKAYSMTSLSSDKSHLRFLVKLEKNGKASTFIRNLKTGDQFDISGPEGSFIIRSKKQNLCCLAVGIGIAPFVSILPHLLQKNFLGNITLVYAAGKGRHFYQKEFKSLAKKHGNFRLIFLADRISAYLSQNYKNFNNHQFYICGNKPAVESICEQLLKHRHRDEKIFTEIFI